MYITVDNELVETSSKRQKTLSSLTPQTRNTNTVTLDYGASLQLYNYGQQLDSESKRIC